MNQNTKRVLALAISGSAIGFVCLANSGEPPADDTGIVQMYRARSIHEMTGWAETVRRELGCDPCNSFLEEDDQGNEIEFLFNPDVSMTLFRSDVSSASIGKVSTPSRPFILILRLTDAGIKRIGDYRGPAETVLTVNEIDGEIVGMMPLWASGRAYMVGSFADLDDAKRVAEKLDVPLRIVIEPTI